MPNLRLLYSNAADSASTLTADTTSGSLVAANLLTDVKTEVHRSTATTLRITAKFANGLKVFNMAALAFTNLTSTATMRSRVYSLLTDVADVSTAAVDSGTAPCCAYAPLGNFTFGVDPLGMNGYPASLGVNQFPYGGFSYGRSYFTATAGRQLVIDITDSDNPAGYIECGRLIAGWYWEPSLGAGGAAKVVPSSNTAHRRTDAGDLKTELRPRSRSVPFDMSVITDASERMRVWKLLRENGMTSPVFFSMYPANADPVLEQANQVWGKLSDSALANPSYGIFAASLEVQET
jgi:hypothetical protein